MEKKLVLNRVLEVHGPDEGLDVASVEFVDPDDPSANICVGFKYLGGDMKNPANWQYDHANRWPAGSREGDQIPLSMLELIGVLNGVDSSAGELLGWYCSQLEV